MSEIAVEVMDVLNEPGRIGALGTADKNGQPNIAYFGSIRPMIDGSISVALMNNRTLKNLAENPLAVLFVVKEGPVTTKTPGYRIYLKARGIFRDGAAFNEIKDYVSTRISPQAASAIVAGVIFDITEIRPLVAMG
ncbi:MAG: pyridoxamine 5'-phosphate oxidase family protein [Syntrophobacteraceae bacterium]